MYQLVPRYRRYHGTYGTYLRYRTYGRYRRYGTTYSTSLYKRGARAKNPSCGRIELVPVRPYPPAGDETTHLCVSYACYCADVYLLTLFYHTCPPPVPYLLAEFGRLNGPAVSFNFTTLSATETWTHHYDRAAALHGSTDSYT